MVKMLGSSWENCGIYFFLLRPVHQGFQNSSSIRRRKSSRRKWRRRRGCKRFRKHGGNETKRRKRRRNEIEIEIRSETKIAKREGAVAETSLPAAPAVTDPAHHAPRMTKRTPRKSHQGGIRRTIQENPRKKKRRPMEMRPPRRNPQLASLQSVTAHLSKRQ